MQWGFSWEKEKPKVQTQLLSPHECLNIFSEIYHRSLELFVYLLILSRKPSQNDKKSSFKIIWAPLEFLDIGLKTSIFQFQNLMPNSA